MSAIIGTKINEKKNIGPEEQLSRCAGEASGRSGAGRLPRATLYRVLGLGETGLSVVGFCQARAIPCVVHDTRAQPPGLAALQARYPNVPVVLGPLTAAALHGASALVVSPGLSAQHPEILAAQAAAGADELEVVGDIELFARTAKAPIVAITGTNGKSSVTTWVADMAKAAGWRTRVGGNLGPPALTLLAQSEPDVYVLELSSFQLQTTFSLHPRAATILNVSEDHLDRHANLTDYHTAKWSILKHAETWVLPRAARERFWLEAHWQTAGPLATQTVVWFGSEAPAAGQWGVLTDAQGEQHLALGAQAVFPVADLQVAGLHQVQNALAALALGAALGLPLSAQVQALRAFTGLPHRCQYLGTEADVAWYNDSKATNPGATLAALSGLAKAHTGHFVLIAGGQAKGAQFVDWRAPLAARGRAVVLLGEDREKIAQDLAGVVPCLPVADLADAIHVAAQQAEPGDVVLFAPGCASFDQFKSFVHRGEVFTAAVRASILNCG